jgi:hypothetical protein
MVCCTARRGPADSDAATRGVDLFSIIVFNLIPYPTTNAIIHSHGRHTFTYVNQISIVV